ncbi:hypothetical protein IMG5_148570 [Ichthyophthirius multifiliis]|uniref:Uncharacterized protein n=1 Tax=Ichthyophthirius multifiliis TaxID=5932 RepID=G0QYB3_ICHMU|nr:hypothetical protein IMG5_148570 [Ichthyophthirius multifiliis]EGR29776.1 hypothetical protein IMG5_148570 [Ichthyophthirius multifiliis]|eukprot:XP_004031012.1 hypothetical protein IMG5_148570 [Ichthyophthirius multifiliis]
MIYFFQIPEIQDDTKLQELPLPAAQLDLQTLQYLKQVDQLRLQYKTCMNYNKIIEIMNLNDGLSNYVKIYDDYLKTNVEILAIIGFKEAQKPKFRYKTFISKDIQEYSTEENSNPEACAAEIMITRYSYAFSFQLDAFHHIQFVLKYINQTFNEEKPFKEIEKIITEINKSLNIFHTGVQPIRRLNNVINDVLYFLVQKQNTLIPEFKQTVFYSVKLIIETNANSLYIEKLRIMREYKLLCQVCKTSFSKLSISYERLMEIQNEIQSGVFDFLKAGMLFYKAYAFWAILKQNHILIEQENYSQKSFNLLSFEICEITKYLTYLYQQYLNMKIDSDYYDYGMQFFVNMFLPFSSKLHKTHDIIRHVEIEKPNPEYIFNIVENSIDYFESIPQVNKN